MTNTVKLLLANGTFHFARMFSGAIFVIYLLGQNVSLATIAFSKAVQLVVTGLFMVPSGMFADKCGRKNSILIACISGALYYALLIRPTPSTVVVGEAFNGIALAFYAGAFESWLFSNVNHNDSFLLNKQLARAREISYLGMVLAGVIGSLLVSWAFSLSLIIIVIAFLLFLFSDENRIIATQNKTLAFRVLFKQSLCSLSANRISAYVALAGICCMGFMQLVYQFWQPFFTNFSEIKIGPTELGLIFAAFMLAQYAVSWFTRTFLLKHSEQIVERIGWVWGLAGIALLVTVGTTTYPAVCLIAFCLFQGMVASGGTLLTALAGQMIDKNIQSTTFSVIELGGRCLGAILLFMGSGIIASAKFFFGWPLVGVVLLALAINALLWRKDHVYRASESAGI